MNNTLENPKGIDVVIQRLQNNIFNNGPWDNSLIDVYGRVYKVPSKKSGFTYEAFSSDKEYVDVFTDDTKSAKIFFIENQKHETDNGINFTNRVKIVFMVNLKMLFGNNGRNDMEVEIQAMELLQGQASFNIKGIEKGVEEVFNDINTDLISKMDVHPYHTFCIYGDLKYKINC